MTYTLRPVTTTGLLALITEVCFGPKKVVDAFVLFISIYLELL